MLHARKDYQERIQDNANLIPENEPVFLLRAQDEIAPELLLRWSAKLRLKGGNHEMAELVEKHAQKMIDWQKNIKKLPDLPLPLLMQGEFEIIFDNDNNTWFLSKINSNRKIELQEKKESSEKGTIINVIEGFNIKVNFEFFLKGHFKNSYSVDGIFSLDCNNPKRLPILTITKIYQ